jgi:hypothetical protein
VLNLIGSIAVIGLFAAGVCLLRRRPRLAVGLAAGGLAVALAMAAA